MKLTDQESYSATVVCDVLDLSRSSYYYRPAEKSDGEVGQAIEAVATQFPQYGTRRVMHQLRRLPYELAVGRKRVRRIMAEKQLLRPQKLTRKRTTNSNHGFQRYPNLLKSLDIFYPDQVWVSDITYIRLDREFVYLAVIMDVFSRAIRGWHLGRTLDQELTLTALKKALENAVPDTHHSDQGVQYAAYDYIHLLKSHGIAISMATVGKAEENGYAERMIRTIKEEEVYLSEYLDFFEAYQQIGHFLEDVYMTKRIHSSLGYLTPVEFIADWQLSRQPVESHPKIT